MKNFLTIMMVYLAINCSAQKLPNPKKPESLNLINEFIYTPYDQVMTILIPLDQNWPKSVPSHIKHILNNSPLFHQVNEPVLSEIPKLILEGVPLNNLTVLRNRFHAKTGLYLYEPLHKDSLNELIDEFCNKVVGYTDKKKQSVRDSFEYSISRIIQLHVRVRDSLGTMIYTPERIALVLEDSKGPSIIFLTVDLNQSFFQKNYRDSSSIYAILKSMEYEYFPINYQFRKGKKLIELRIASYENSLAVKYAIMSGGTELFKKNISNQTSYITMLPKIQRKSESKWQQARSRY